MTRSHQNIGIPLSSLQNGTVYVGVNNAIRALDLEGRDLWAYHVEGNDSIVAGPLLARPPPFPHEEPFVFFGTQGGLFLAVQPQVRSYIRDRLLLVHRRSSYQDS